MTSVQYTRVFIINGTRKLKQHAQQVIASFPDAIRHVTQSAGDATEFTSTLLRESKEEVFYIIIAVGGDGTCNEVVNGIMRSGKTNYIFGIIPNGTGNDFQRSLDNFNTEKFIQCLSLPNWRRIDAIKVESSNGVKYALNVAGGGFDGFVVCLLNKQRRFKLTGGFSYALAIVRAFLTYKRPEVEVTYNDQKIKANLLMIAVCNGSTFGSGLVIHPNAKIDNGKLGVTLLKDVSLLDYVRNVGKLRKGELIRHSEIQYEETEELVLKAEKEIYFETDGELLRAREVTFSIEPGALNLIS